MVLQGAFSYPPRDNSWSRSERPSFVELSQDTRYQQPSTHALGPPTVQDVLKDCVGGTVKDFAMILLLESGEEKIYSSKSLALHRSRIITDEVKQNFRQSVQQAERERQYPNTGYSQDGMYNEFELGSGEETRKNSTVSSSSEYGRRHHPRKSRSDNLDDDEPFSARKRPRYPVQTGQESIEDTLSPVPVQKTQQLMIGDDAEVEKFYVVRFKDMQQWSCKIMGKAFVKLVEPKKQTHHPYTKKNEGAPPWWPNTTGEKSVRHKEPDHLLKPERIQLLVHILKLIVEPREKQCAAVQKLGLNVKKLEEVTLECLSNWFNDKEHVGNAQKRPYLREIFKVAKAQERYKNGEIDGTTIIPVMYGDRAAASCSEEEPDDVSSRDDDAEPMHHIPTNLPTPESSVSPPMSQHLQSNPEGDSVSIHRMQHRLPVRHNSQPHLHESSFNDGHFFTQPQSPSLGLHDPSRRSFVSPGFSSPQQPIHGWQNQMINTSSGGSNFYVTSPQSSLPPLTGPYLPPPHSQQPMHPPQLIPQHFDGLPNGLSTGRAYDTGPALGHHQLRTGSLSHPNYMPSQGFEGFLHDNGGVNVGFGSHEQELKDEQQSHLQHN